MSDLNEIEVQLAKGFTAMGLTLDPNLFARYLVLLQQWNQTYNLTAIRDIPSMIEKHILDSLAILPWMRGQYWLDVGTGAGIPGIPLALASQDVEVTLLDSNGKKISFLREVVRQLSLAHVQVVESRIESYRPVRRFDTVVSRALSALRPMIESTNHLVHPQGLRLAMKGHIPEDELQSINEMHLSYQTKLYTVPGILGARCCILIEPSP